MKDLTADSMVYYSEHDGHNPPYVCGPIRLGELAYQICEVYPELSSDEVIQELIKSGSTDGFDLGETIDVEDPEEHMEIALKMSRGEKLP